MRRVSAVNRGKRGSRMFNDASGKIENLMGMMCRGTVGERDRGRAPVPEFLQSACPQYIDSCIGPRTHQMALLLDLLLIPTCPSSKFTLNAVLVPTAFAVADQ